MITSYRTVAGTAVAEVEFSRSRFLCTLARVEDEMEARAVIDAARRQHWDARHHCSAFVLGPEGALMRSNDDGEPAGTAGAPILEVLRGAPLSDVVAVVTRWFGGTLLGTGGLTRAYSAATKAALEEATVIERVLQQIHVVTVDHADVGRLEHGLRARGAAVLGVDYTDRAHLRLAIAPRALSSAQQVVAELTGGQAVMREVGQEWVDL